MCETDKENRIVNVVPKDPRKGSFQVSVSCPKSCIGDFEINNPPPWCPFTMAVDNIEIISKGVKPSALKGGTCWNERTSRGVTVLSVRS